MIAELLKNKKIIASAVIIALLLFLIYAGLPFLSAFFGALILTYIFDPLNKRLKKRFSPVISAWIILIISLVVVIIPTIFLVNGLIKQISYLPSQVSNIQKIETRINEIAPVNISIDQGQLSQQAVSYLTNSISPAFSNILQAGLVLFLLFFLLYYFLIESQTIKDLIMDIIPFNQEHKIRMIRKFHQITYSTIIGTFLIALIQGGLLTLNFLLLGIPNALFWGFVTAILSFLPIIGAPIIWGPAAFFLIIAGELGKGIAMIVVGMMISTIDNILRPIINDKYGSVHPLISIVGIYIGVAEFGLVGLFIGPLLVAYLLLFWQMYKEEYKVKISF